MFSEMRGGHVAARARLCPIGRFVGPEEGSVAMVKPRETTWNDVKTELLQFDRTGLLGC